jgi:Phage terminase large subunit (GpA)
MTDFLKHLNSDHLAAIEGLNNTELAFFLGGMYRPAPVFTPGELEQLSDWTKVSGIRPEGSRVFDISSRPYLRDLYTEKRSQPHSRNVVMKAGQTGLTIRFVYRATWLVADARKMVNTTIYFPSLESVTGFSASRFSPMMRSSNRMMQLIEDVDSVKLKRVGMSNLRFRGMNSDIGLDSDPMDAVLFDEARFMRADRIRRALVRVSESDFIDPVTGARGIAEINSTAGFPESDVHHWFLRSTQNYWTTPCPNPSCRHAREHEWIILPLSFPDCVGRDGTRLFYCCPECRTEIPDEVLFRFGKYRMTNPDALQSYEVWRGHQFSRLLRGTSELPAIWAWFDSGENLAEFHNSVLGLPYLDPSAVIVTPAALESCIDGNKTFGWQRSEDVRDQPQIVCLGVDQKGSQKHCVVARAGLDGVYELLDLAVIEESGIEAIDPTVELAKRWGARVVVLDGEPSYDYAVGVARALPKGVTYLCDYAEEQDNAIEWFDETKKRSTKRSSGETAYEYSVLIDRFKGMDWALGKFPQRRVRLPYDFQGKLIQRTRHGVKAFESVADEYRKHMRSIAKAVAPRTMSLESGETILIPGKFRRVFRHLNNNDADFAHATLYAFAGLSKLSGRTQVIVTANELNAVASENQLDDLLPTGMKPRDVAAQKAGLKVCGGCKYWERTNGSDGRCGHPGSGGVVMTGETDLACPYFAKVS